MNLLLDEMFDAAVASALNVFAYRHQCIFTSINASSSAGTKDEVIPQLCKDRGVAALITANVHDFGAKQALYQALLDAGVSVAVVRPGKQKLTPETQLSILSGQSLRIAEHLQSATQCILLRVTQGGIVERTLDELREEIEGRSQLP